MTSIDRFPPRQIKDADDIGSNPTDNSPLIEIAEHRYSRRAALRSFGLTGAAGLFSGLLGARSARAEGNPSSLTFEEIEHGIDDGLRLAKGYRADILIRWGDKVAKDAPAFEAGKSTAAAQAKQFGYNNDFIGFLSLPQGSNDSDHGLLCVNHEYTNAELMFPGLTEEDKLDKISADQVAAEMEAHGHSIIEIKRDGGKWQVVEDSAYNRRITATTPMAITGPAAGSDRLKTSADATGKAVLGMINNCSGGVTPWGTILTCEENFNNYFGGDPSAAPDAASFKRYGVKGEPEYGWWRYEARFDLSKEPNEPNRFGWVVEIDPFDPGSQPAKRTALGRLKHEAATSLVDKSGHVVVYLGDDERFDYLYRFVSKGTFDPSDRKSNLGLLDEGTLSVAKFDPDGKLHWLPLTFGEGPLTEANGFKSAADVLIEARRAADLLGATPMDRPEDVETDPVTGRVYTILTNNSKRGYDRLDAANPRADNEAGHIVELIPAGGEGKDADHTAAEYKWDMFLVAGNPLWGTTLYGKGTSKNGWLACPDNMAFDPKGRLWIATDQGGTQKKFGIGDGLYGTDVAGDGRAVTRKFLAMPRDAETCGPSFTPDGKTLFIAVQHPGEGSTFAEPSTRWPDFDQTVPPRPAVIAIVKEDGGEIGA
jgi:secreted PhoX family phosphatase